MKINNLLIPNKPKAQTERNSFFYRLVTIFYRCFDEELVLAKVLNFIKV